ncbi:MAG: hypothetical protein AAF798_17200 [Bacteroidota bacterium]
MKHITITLMNLLLVLNMNAMQLTQSIEEATLVEVQVEATASSDACCDQPNFAVKAANNNGPEKAKKAAAIKKLHNGIVGNWENTVYPFEVDEAGVIPGAFLTYNFHQSGHYTKIVGNKDVAIKEQGQWSISANGSSIIMEANNGNISEATIKHLQLDELVLEHELKVNNAAFCTKEKSFFFNKQ